MKQASFSLGNNWTSCLTYSCEHKMQALLSYFNYKLIDHETFFTSVVLDSRTEIHLLSRRTSCQASENTEDAILRASDTLVTSWLYDTSLPNKKNSFFEEFFNGMPLFILGIDKALYDLKFSS